MGTQANGRLSLGDLGKMDAAGLANVRLFLTSRGDPVTPRMFRSDYWSPALRAAGIVAPPHIARHWFVTNALRTIERTAANENEMVRRKTELVQYMAWKTAERTLKAYEHVVRDKDFITTTLQSIHEAMKRSRIRPWHRGLAEGKDLCQLAQIRGQGVADLNPLLGEP